MGIGKGRVEVLADGVFAIAIHQEKGAILFDRSIVESVGWDTNEPATSITSRFAFARLSRLPACWAARSAPFPFDPESDPWVVMPSFRGDLEI
jgi:hypothetical protein